MGPINGFTVTPHHRQNRRRERPGSRTRRTLTRRAVLQQDFSEGLIDAFDTNVSLPSDKTKPSPLLRHNFDKSWQRWKARQAAEEEESAQATREMDLKRETLLMELESEQLRLFGGDVDDDELYRMGILYRNDNEDIASNSDEDSNTVSCDAPVEGTPPLYLIRHRKPRHSRRRPASLRFSQFCLSFSAPLSSDAEIARFLSAPEFVPVPTFRPIQHRHSEPHPIDCSTDTTEEDPCPSLHQSLPPPVQFPLPVPIAPIPLQPRLSLSPIITIAHTFPSNPPPSFPTTEGDWTFITSKPPIYTTPTSTPASEPETWILLSDDS